MSRCEYSPNTQENQSFWNIMDHKSHPDVGTPRQAKGPYVKTPKRGSQRGPHPPSPTGKEIKAAMKHLPKEEPQCTVVNTLDISTFWKKTPKCGTT